MNTVALVLFIFAAIVFLLADQPFWGRVRFSPVPLGLLLLTVGFMVQLLSLSHPQHF